MYAFLKANRMTFWAAVTGMVVFVFSAFLSLHFTQAIVFMTMIWLPMELYFVNRIVSGGGQWRHYGGLIVCLLFSFLSAFPQVLMYNSYFLGAYWLFLFCGLQKESGRSVISIFLCSLREVLKIGGVFLMVILLGAVQFIPAAENWYLSSRQQFGFTQIADESLPWHYLIHGLVPNFFGISGGAWAGVPFWGFNKDTLGYATYHAGSWQYWEFGFYAGQLAVIAAVVLAFNFRKLWAVRRAQMFFLCALLPILWLMMGRYGGLFNGFYHMVPGFSLFRTPARIGCLLDFSLAITVAVLVDVLLERKVNLNFRRPVTVLGVLYGILVIGFLAVGSALFPELKNEIVWTHSMQQLMLSVVLFCVVVALLTLMIRAWSVQVRLVVVATLGLVTFIDLFLAFSQFHSGTVNPEQYYGDRNNLIKQMSGMRGQMGPFRFAQLVDGKISEEVVLPRNTAYLYPGLEVPEGYLLFNARDYGAFASSTNQQARLAILNVRVIANANRQTGRVEVMAYTNSFPRAKFFHSVRAYQDDTALYADLDSGRLNYWQQVGIFSNDAKRCGISLAEPPPDAKAEVRFIPKTAEEYQISYNTTAPGIIFISECFYPGWEADGGQYPIIHAFGAFKGIVIPKAGSGVISVKFSPRVLWIGLAVSGVTLGLLFAVLVVSVWRERRCRAGGVS